MELALILGIVLVVYLFWDHYRHPKKACPRCDGSGRKRSRWNGKAYGLCRRCRGRGEVRR